MKNDELTIYSANYKAKLGIFSTIILMVQNIVRSRELILQLFKRDFIFANRKSLFGISWIVIGPVVGIVSWVFMNSAGILQPGDVGVPYPAYVLIGSSLWGLFMGFFTSAQNTLAAGAGFINQIKYPHEALLAKETAQHIANFLISFVLNIIILILFGVVPDWKIILFPILCLPMFFTGAAIGLVVSVFTVVTTDLGRIFTILFSIIFYLTPLVYTQNSVSGDLRKIISLNPLTYIIGTVRDLIIYGDTMHWDRFLIWSVVSLILFLIALRVFFVSEDKVVERMS